MNEITVLVIAIVGGLAGIIIVGVAIWMMRQETPATPPLPDSAAPATTEPIAAPVAEPVAETNKSDWMSQLREAPPPLIPQDDSTPTQATGFVATLDPELTPSLSGTPPALETLPPFEAPSSTPAPTTPAIPATGWFTSLTSRVASAVPSAPAPTLAPQELLRLLRTPEGDLIVEVYGRRYRTRADITDAPVEQQINNASSDLSRFLTNVANEALKATPPTAMPPLPLLSVLKKETPENRTVVKVSLQEAAQMEVIAPKMDIMHQVRYVREQQKKPMVQIKTVMEEIDEVLQVMLIGTPLATRGLKAADSPHGAVFVLDGINYDSLDTLPDPEARELFRAAIQKWDQK
jgi:hypothetical protein